MLSSHAVTQQPVVLIHDYLNQYGGAERVLEALHDLYPTAPVYTSIYDPAAMPTAYRNWDIRPSWMQRLPLWRRFFRMYFPLYPFAFESLDLRSYDLLVSSSSAYAKGIRPRAGAFHVCYCHTPMRFAWQTASYMAREGVGTLPRAVLWPLLALLRSWDRRTSHRVNLFIANSSEVADRISRWYGRTAVVIPPPVDLPPPTPLAPPDDYYLTGGRLVPYKRIDLAVQACTALKLPLVVFGEGRDRQRLEQLAGPNVRFVGHVSQVELQRLYSHCRAYITAFAEDAGIQPVEAMAAGRPVVAFAGGGALETVIDGVTGRFFHHSSPAALAVAIAQSRVDRWQPAVIQTHAQQFRREIFCRRVAEAIDAARHPDRAIRPSQAVSDQVATNRSVWN
ncbi:MAG: glycosyltransferase [Herpetosiphon sp.]